MSNASKMKTLEEGSRREEVWVEESAERVLESTGQVAKVSNQLQSAEQRLVAAKKDTEMDALRTKLEVKEDSSIYCAALLAFESLCEPFEMTHHAATYKVNLSSSLHLVSLAGVVSASVAEERSRAAKSFDPLEIGHQLIEVLDTPTHLARRQSLENAHLNTEKEKAFGEKLDVRKSALDMGDKPVSAPKARAKRPSRTNLDATGDIAKLRNSVAAANALVPDHKAKLSPKVSSPRSPRATM